ncbi:putative conserved protein [Rhizobium favelukesii]|uniref:Conserved protein n=1 Tax=Rhizobium favelukesii TaxID=348824 RepID=W6RBG0_9HYPH|nr:hypothetical protein [Rhizobium favelukesii]CDM57660.1 putative conserved protein [Rhizobium favelukesii]
MASQAEKLRRKRAAQGAGRPRKQGVDRYPSGKIKPAETEKETQSVAIQARKRVNGWSDETPDKKALDPRAGYTLGLICIDGKITEEQMEIGNEYALAIARYHRLVGIPFPSARAQSLFSIKGHDGEVTDEHAARARSASNLMMRLQGILLQCVDGPQVRQTVNSVSVMDLQHLRDMPPQQLLWLRRGLTALINSGALPNHNRNATDITRFEVRASA